MGNKNKHGRVTDLEGDPQNISSENFGGGKSGRTRPELVKRRMHRKSTIVSGRTIGEKRERLETKNERAAARKKHKARAGVKSPHLKGLSLRASDCFSRKRRSNKAIMKNRTFSF